MLKTSRYGRKQRKKINNVLKNTRGKHVCPKCGKKSLKRVSFAVFICKSCGAVVAGGAYEPTTDVGRAAARMISALKEREE